MRHEIIATKFLGTASDPYVRVTARFVSEGFGSPPQYSPEFQFVISGVEHINALYRSLDLSREGP